MIKYRVYDTRANKYLDRKSVAIDGNGVLQIDKRALGYIVRIPHSEKNPMFIIEQYTGLKDNNGVEIAAGDILMDDTGEYIEYWTVSFSGGSFIGECTGVSESLFELTDLEVIGNIHDSANLLEEDGA